MKPFALTLIALAAFSLQGFGQTTDADNTGKNTRDASGDTLTPIDQSNDPADIKITAEARKLVVADESLSIQAKNVKIITVDGVVTLRGPVETAKEKTLIAKCAKKAGAKSVVNQLEVKKD